MLPVAVVAPDKFKGSLSAVAAAAAIARGLRAAWGDALESRIVPMADGGEGTVEAFVATGARRIEQTVHGPLGTPVRAAFALDGDLAIVEMAAASGLTLLSRVDYNPSRATTYGTGELIAAALDAGARRILVAAGGSATNDGGAGMLTALGVKFLDADAREIAQGGGALSDLACIDVRGLDPRLNEAVVEVAADVESPLLGPRGATATFARQKGADERDIERLEAALAHYAGVVAAALGRDVREVRGTGAAGGLGFGLCAFLNASIRPGVEVVAQLRGLPEALEGATWCFTGEGAIDEQTLQGKTVAGVARFAQASGVPTFAFAGSVTSGAAAQLRELDAVAVEINPDGLDVTQAIARASELLQIAAARTAGGLRDGAIDAAHR